MQGLRHHEGADDMRKSRFTDEKGTVAPDGAAQAPTNRSSGCIKEQEAGMATSEVCRRHGLSLATFHQLRARHGDMDVSNAQGLRALENENGTLRGFWRMPCPTMLC